MHLYVYVLKELLTYKTYTDHKCMTSYNRKVNLMTYDKLSETDQPLATS